MRHPARGALSLIILAGGQGERLGGRDKAQLRVKGRRMVDRLCAELGSQAAEIIIVRSRPRDGRPLPAGVKRAWDRRPKGGPVPGLEAGLRRASRAWCLCLPVDSLPPAKRWSAQLARQSRGGAFTQYQGDQYYLHALIRRRDRQALRRFLAADGRSAANAARHLGLHPVELDRADRATVWSINTRDEQRQQQRRRR